jgi:hypothetical protein
MEDFKYESCESKDYKSLNVLCEKLVIYQSLNLSIKNEKGCKYLCIKCNKNYKRIFKTGSDVICSDCYEKKNLFYNKCIDCKADAKLINNKCFICLEIEDIKEGIRDFINIKNNNIVCKGCLIEKKSTEYRLVKKGYMEHLCKYCIMDEKFSSNYFNIDYYELEVYYENCIHKFYNSIILLGNQLLMLHYMRKKSRKQIGYRTYCDKCESNSMRISELKETYLCSSCEKKEDKDYGKCNYCNCESKLLEGNCFICIDIENVKKGLLDFININESSLMCNDCNIEKESTENIKIETETKSYYLNLCKYCYLSRINV